MADTDTFLPKLSDEEKKVLIKFYKENPALWNSSDPYYKNKVQRSLIKTKLLALFENKYTEDVLEKTFHSLRTSMLREVKKLDNGIITKKIWKFFDDMEFLRGDLNKKKGVQFEADELGCIIDFYRENASLWNHHLNEYRDRNLREVLLDKLAVEFNGKFTVADLNNGITLSLRIKGKNNAWTAPNHLAQVQQKFMYQTGNTLRLCVLLMSLLT